MISSTPVSRRDFLAATAASCTAAGLPATVAASAQRLKEPENLKLIDCHLHFNHKKRSIAETIEHMNATGTERAFILPLETGEGGVLLKSQTVIDSLAKYPGRIIPFCQSDIRQADVLQRIRTYREAGCRGIGEQKEHVRLNDPRVEAVIALCDELNWPITIHFQDGNNGYNQGLADHLEKYLKRYKRVRIIGHAQTWWAHISAKVPDPTKSLYPKGPVKEGGVIDRLLTKYPNLYADLSAGSGYNALTRDEPFTASFIARHPQQLIFGSDCPCFDGKGGQFNGVCYSQRLQAFLQRTVKDRSILQDICYHNALRALNGKASS